MTLRGVTARLIAAFVVAVGLAPSTAHATPRRHSVAPAVRGIAEVRRVMVVVLENTDAARALEQPFLAEIGSRGALLRNYHALAHPSQPNYIAMVAGSDYGIANDDPVVIDVAHLGDLLEEHGLNWKVYAEDYPGGCFTGKSHGNYVRRHVPFLSFANVLNDPARCGESIVDATRLDADVAANALPAFSLYVPNLKNDGHDTGVPVADSWLRARFGPLLDNDRFMSGTLLVVTFDEGSTNGPNIVYFALYGAGVDPGSSTADYYDHYSLLRTVEEIFHVGTLHHHDDAAGAIHGVWRR